MQRDRRWLARSRPLGRAAPPWARRMYRRSLLVLRALVDPRSGAAVAGARAGWAYVWPRDAGAVAIALASAGYREEARRVAGFLLDLDLDAAARFSRTGEPVEGRAAQGDAAGWVAAAARAAGVGARPPTSERPAPVDRENFGAVDPARAALRFAAWRRSPAEWRGRADYQEKDRGDYLGNAIASTGVDERDGGRRDKSARRRRAGWIESVFGSRPSKWSNGGPRRDLVRVAGDPDSGLDAAAAWAVRPFSTPALYPAVRRTLLRLVAERESPYGLLPSESWSGGDDPWTAPTAWTAWALAAPARAGEAVATRRRPPADRERRNRLARRDRRAALRLMADLRRAATPLGLLPERVDAETGQPTSTTPLAWSHAFAILAIRELWPN
jgi:glucoamylase